MSDDEPVPAAQPSAEAARPARWSRGRVLGWLATVGLFFIALASAPSVVDADGFDRVLVAATAALPFGLIGSRPALGWLVSLVTALVVSRAYPVLDDDPWPWPIVHGLVLLALLFATASRAARGSAGWRQAAVVVSSWLATVALFGFSVAPQLRAGWAVGVTAIVAAGVGLRLIAARRAPAPTTAPGPDRQPPDGPSGGLRQGFQTAFVTIAESQRLGRPLAERYLGNPDWLVWLRAALPWIAAFGTFWLALATIPETHAIDDQVLLPVLAALVALPVGLAGGRVLLGWRVATLTAGLLALTATPSDSSDPAAWPLVLQYVWLGVTFLVSARHDRWTTIWVWAATVAVMFAGASANTGTAILLSVVATALVFVGDLVRSRRQATAALEHQTELSELEKARRTVLEEKARIARDLHDIVAHHMSMVVVQAETAPFRIDGMDDPTRAEFGSISESARKALGEIRGLLGVLRSADDQAARAPQPGLGQLADLVDGAGQAGLPVAMAVTGRPRAVGAATGLSAYRIVQESLANAARHAPGAHVDVRLHYGPDALAVRVVNAAPQAPVVVGLPGHGLIGMHERATVVGGTLEAGPSADGGFEVDAHLPLDPPPKDEEAT